MEDRTVSSLRRNLKDEREGGLMWTDAAMCACLHSSGIETGEQAIQGQTLIGTSAWDEPSRKQSDKREKM